MIRQLVSCKDTKICHVNSVDNTPTYEALTSYQAGCVVQYAGVPYMAIVDIADDDTDTPDIAPSKWAIVADADSLAAEGELSNLDTRVSALEDTLENKYLLTQRITSVQVKSDGIKTTKDCLDDLSSALLTAASALSDDQYIEPVVLFCGGYAWMGSVGFNYLTNATTSFNIPFNRSVLSGGDMYNFIAALTDVVSNPNALTSIKIESTPAVTITDRLSDVPVADTTFEVQYKVWTKVTS